MHRYLFVHEYEGVWRLEEDTGYFTVGNTGDVEVPNPVLAIKL